MRSEDEGKRLSKPSYRAKANNLSDSEVDASSDIEMDLPTTKSKKKASAAKPGAAKEKKKPAGGKGSKTATKKETKVKEHVVELE